MPSSNDNIRANELRKAGLEENIVQINNSLSLEKGTIRGIHYQLAPKAETKIVRILNGSVYDVIVDMRPDSSTFLKWFGIELSSKNRMMMYVPRGFAHGFLTLEDNTEAFYLVSEFYDPKYERCLRWNDPFLNIHWPIEPRVVSEKDRSHPDFNFSWHCNTQL